MSWLLVDTNVLIDILANDPEWADWSLAQLRRQSVVHRLAINPVIYAELALAFNTHAALDQTIEQLALELLEIPRPALFLAGKAYARYRQRGGDKKSVLADFFIGAHAAVLGCPLLTRDSRRYQREFRGLELITP